MQKSIVNAIKLLSLIVLSCMGIALWISLKEELWKDMYEEENGESKYHKP